MQLGVIAAAVGVCAAYDGELRPCWSQYATRRCDQRSPGGF
ncbi:MULTISPECIES: hypothetical protein [Streptomyces]|nr:hypothetical protein [Streptomyces sp. GbtcB7]